jgi:phosphatidylserine/phosphatidylglycerophosphate/cardiolipin synthase-like enzyme
VEKPQEERTMSGSASDPVERIVLTPADRRPALVEVISSARHTLSLSLFRCDDQAVLDALAAAVRRGVRVRALITSRAKGSKAQLKELAISLKAMGADVRRYSDAVVRYHAKYVVADDGPALIGSLNFTRKCFHDTCDFMLITHDRDLVAELTRLFDADWDEKRYMPSTAAGDRLIVGPEGARRRFAAMFQTATSQIRIIDPKIDDAAMLALLKARAAAGVKVEIRGPHGLGALIPHGKLLLIDDSTAAIGSISLSMLALEFRRELAVVIERQESLRALDEFWRSLPAPATADDAPGVSGDPFLPA